jgi:hypothetical protein
LKSRLTPLGAENYKQDRFERQYVFTGGSSFTATLQSPTDKQSLRRGLHARLDDGILLPADGDWLLVLWHLIPVCVVERHALRPYRYGTEGAVGEARKTGEGFTGGLSSTLGPE